MMSEAFQKELLSYAALANEMADAARTVIRPYFRSGVTIEIKPDSSPVTIADRESEKTMRAMIEARFPEHAIVGEEFPNKETGSPWRWILDPIDGTKSFTAGSYGFGVLIALCFEGEPVLGVLDQPILNERWVACGDQPTRFNGEIIRTQSLPALDQAIIHCSGTGYFSPSQLAAYNRLEAACCFPRLSMDCYGYGLVALGAMHLSVDGAVNAYDIAALMPIVRNAGGVVSDWRGDKINLDEPVESFIAAADQQLLEQALLALDY